MTRKPHKDDIPDPHCRSARPAHIDVGADVLIRNDVIALAQGVSVRTVDRGDRLGAPFTYVGGVKYRPKLAYFEFLMSQIRTAKPPRQTRRR